MVDRKQLAIDFAKSLNHPEIEKIILFGSVARKEDTSESDIDVLIVTNKRSDKFEIEDDVYNKVWNILLMTGENISVKMRSSNYYEKNKNYSFLSNVNKDGILIG
ncbi:MAG: nucleotidyltransferase domain-containing protein [Methanobrevibacter sp.]|nr:nucleotidyltransferase domain-containing protein [Methanobrevibacter sp.]